MSDKELYLLQEACLNNLIRLLYFFTCSHFWTSVLIWIEIFFRFKLEVDLNIGNYLIIVNYRL